MSATVIKEFLVSLGFDVKTGELNKFSGGINAAGVQAAAMGAALLGAATAITAFVSHIAGEMDTLQDLAEATNNSSAAIDKLGYIAELSDSSISAVNSSLATLNKNAGDAAMGIGRAKVVFEKMGISVKDSNGKLKNSASLMTEIGDKIKGMEKGQQQAVLSRLGIDPTLLKTLTTDVSGLADGYDKMMEAAGFSFEEATQNASDFEDSQIKLGLTFKKLQQAIASKFFKYIAKSFDQMTQLIVKNMPLIVKSITPIIEVVFKLVDLFAFLASTVLQVIGFIVGGLVKLNDATDGWAGYIMGAIVAWKLLNATFLASPIGMVLALAAAIALLVDDFNVWQEGGKSLIDWGKWKEEVDLVIGFIDLLQKNISTSFQIIFAAIDGVVKLLKGDLSGAFIAATDAALNFLSLFSNVADFAGQISNYAQSPSPAEGAGMGGGGSSINQQTTINVNGGDPAATGRAVADEQSRVNADMARNAKSASW